MDNEDFGRNNPPFQRYIPPCYKNHQKYVPSLYFTKKDSLPDKDTLVIYAKKVKAKGQMKTKVPKVYINKKSEPVIIS